MSAASADESLLSVLRDRLDLTGNKVWVRRRPMWRLYGVAGWQAGALLSSLRLSAAANPTSPRLKAWKQNGRSTPVQAGLRRGRRLSVRLLHLRHGTARHRAAARNAASDGRPNRRPHEWQYLPLRRLSAHHCRGAAGLATAAKGRWPMNCPRSAAGRTCAAYHRRQAVLVSP